MENDAHELAKQLKRSQELSGWLASQVAGTEFKNLMFRRRCAAVCFGVAQDHHASFTILLLQKPPLHSTAFAIVRLQYEAYIRGTWLLAAASDHEVEAYGKGRQPKIMKMIKAIEAVGPVEAIGKPKGIFSSVHARTWDRLCGLAHTGVEHINRWGDGNVLRPTYSSTEALILLAMTSLYAVLATASIAFIGGRHDVQATIISKGRLMAPTAPPP